MNNNSSVFDTNVLFKRYCAIDCRLIHGFPLGIPISGERSKTSWIGIRIMFPCVTTSTCFYPEAVVFLEQL